MEAMPIPKGYKYTEVGIIPNDWNIFKMDLICDVRDGTHESPKYHSSGVIFITSKNIVNGKIDFTEINYIAKEDAINIDKRSKVDKGDILMSMIGTIGDCVLIDFEPNFCIKNVALLKPQKVEGEFLVQLLFSQSYQSYIKSKLDGGIQKFISLKVLRSLDVPLPPTLDEQTTIAAALHDADALISSLERLIAKKRSLKHGAMQELLQPQAGWEVKKLGEIAEIVGGGTPSTFNSNYWNGDINWFTPTEIGLCKYTYKSIRRITKNGLNNSSAKLLPIGTILLTSRATIGDMSILMMKGCTNQGFQSLITKKGFNNEFLYYLMLTLKPLLIQNASGSTFLEISPGKLKQLEISIPDYEVQTRIARTLADMDAEIEALEQKLAKYRLLKQGMMQQLLTGSIRLPH